MNNNKIYLCTEHGIKIYVDRKTGKFYATIDGKEMVCSHYHDIRYTINTSRKRRQAQSFAGKQMWHHVHGTLTYEYMDQNLNHVCKNANGQKIGLYGQSLYLVDDEIYDIYMEMLREIRVLDNRKNEFFNKHMRNNRFDLILNQKDKTTDTL